MFSIKRVLTKACRLIVAEGLLVFFRKAIRRLFWSIGGSFLSNSNKISLAHHKTLNRGAKLFLVKKLGNDIEFHDTESSKLIYHFKEELMKITQKKKF
jgi:hypothetical protein